MKIPKTEREFEECHLVKKGRPVLCRAVPDDLLRSSFAFDGMVLLTGNDAGEILEVLKVVKHMHDNDNFVTPAWNKKWEAVIKILESKLSEDANEK